MGFTSRFLRQLRQLPLFMQRRPSLHSVKTKTPPNIHPSIDTDVRSPLSPITEENVSSIENMAPDGRLGDQASHGRHSVSFPTPDLDGSADLNANPVREVPASSTAAALNVQPKGNQVSAAQQTLHETIDAPISTGYTPASLLQHDQFIRVVPSSCFIIPCGHDDYLIRVLRHVNLGDVEFARSGTVKLVAPDAFYEPQIGHCVLVQFGVSKYISRVLLKISAEEGPISEPYRAMDPHQDFNASQYHSPSPPPRHSFRPEPVFSDTPMTQSTMRVLHTPARVAHSAFGTPVHGTDHVSQLGGLRRGYVQTDVDMQNPPTEAKREVGDDQLVSSVELMATLNLRSLPSRGELPDRQGEEISVPTPHPLPLSDPRMDISPPSSEDEGPSETPLTYRGVRADAHRSPNQTSDSPAARGPSSQFTSPSTSPPISNSSSESIANDEYGYPKRRAKFKSHKSSLHSRRGTLPLNRAAVLNHYSMPSQLPPGFQPFGPVQSTSVPTSSTQDMPYQSQRGDRRSRDVAVRFSEHSATLGHADTQGVFAGTVSDVPASGLWDQSAFFSNVSQRAPEGRNTIPLPPVSPRSPHIAHSNPSRDDATHTPG
ncbi:hypothetical protein Moror_989 [Moniliophthora roreri MCA 2997]|nr:hypothetical protein Moror_989 [Moniliophthora roreri MCA 2997]